MKRDDKMLCCIGVLCLAGCMFIAVFNAAQASWSKADVIQYADYSKGISLSDIALNQSDKNSLPEHDTININTATADELAEFLPGIGPSKAAKIVQYREASGGFDSVDELINVSGIGEKTLANLRPYCRVSD